MEWVAAQQPVKSLSTAMQMQGLLALEQIPRLLLLHYEQTIVLSLISILAMVVVVVVVALLTSAC